MRPYIVLAAPFAYILLSACTVEERPARPPESCRNAVWIEGHRGPRGRWHPGHWRCEGVVEVVEVE